MPRTDMKININGQMVALPEGFDDYIDWSRAAIVELDMHGGHLDPEPDCPAPSARGRDIIDDVNKFNQAWPRSRHSHRTHRKHLPPRDRRGKGICLAAHH